jgi:Tfp pilus assembly major pilin PilA
MDVLASGAQKVAHETVRVGRVIGIIKTFGIVMVALVLFVLGGWQYTRVEVRNKVTEAKITEVVFDTQREKPLYMSANYEFTVGSETFTGQGTMRNPVAGNTVMVEYNGDNPRDNAIDTNPVHIAIGLWGAAIFALLIAGVYYYVSQNYSMFAGSNAVATAVRMATGGASKSA